MIVSKPGTLATRSPASSSGRAVRAGSRQKSSPAMSTTGRPPYRCVSPVLTGATLRDLGLAVLRHLVEGGVLLAGVHPVLVLDHAELGEALAQPPVGRVEET